MNSETKSLSSAGAITDELETEYSRGYRAGWEYCLCMSKLQDPAADARRVDALQDEMRERDYQWLELIEVCDKAMDGLHLPLEDAHCTNAELAAWSDAITTVLKNHGLARVVIESRLQRHE